MKNIGRFNRGNLLNVSLKIATLPKSFSEHMFYTKSLVICLLLLSASCHDPETQLEWIQVNTSELNKGEAYDFSAIKEAIGTSRIVAIGESTHGSGTYYHLKSELVQYLHSEMGFEVLAMESGLGDTYLAYSDIDSLSAVELRDYSVFGNFRAKEANSLFEYIKHTSNSSNALSYVGYDTQASSDYLFDRISEILIDYNSELSDSLNTRMQSYQRAYGYGYNQDSLNYIKHRDIFVNTSNTVRSIFENNKTEIIKRHDLTELDFEVMVKSLKMFAESYNLPYPERWNGIALRDELMAANLEWLLSEVYPKKKFIVWAHNAHVEKGKLEGVDIKWMGHFLKEKYEEDYYAIGLFASGGSAYQYWTQDTIPLQIADSTYIEDIIGSSGKQTAFLNLNDVEKQLQTNWLFQPVKAVEIENNGVVNFVPVKRFDGLIVVEKSEAPTYQ